MPLRLVINNLHACDRKRSGSSPQEFAVELTGAETLKEARSFQNGSVERYFEMLEFQDPFEHDEPMEVLATLLFYQISNQGSLGRALEHVLTEVYAAGVRVGYDLKASEHDCENTPYRWQELEQEDPLDYPGKKS